MLICSYVTIWRQKLIASTKTIFSSEKDQQLFAFIIFGLNLFHSFPHQSGFSITGFSRNDDSHFYFLARESSAQRVACLCVCLRFFTFSSTGLAYSTLGIFIACRKMKTKSKKSAKHAAKDTKTNVNWFDDPNTCGCVRVFTLDCSLFQARAQTHTDSQSDTETARVCLFGNLICTQNLDSLGRHTIEHISAGGWIIWCSGWERVFTWIISMMCGFIGHCDSTIAKKTSIF